MKKRDYKFCPKCGGKLELTQIKHSEPERHVCEDCSFVFYPDLKVAACTISTIEGRIPLLKRGIEPSYGKWVFPGGFVERGERVQDAAVRETKEEANLDVEVKDIVGVYSYEGLPIVIIVFSAEVVAGNLGALDESLEAETFEPNQIPWDDLAFPSTRDALKDYVERYFD